MKSLKRQYGGLEVIAFAVLLLFSTISMLYVVQQMEQFSDSAANQSGVYAAQFKHALQSKLTQDGAAIVTGTFNGTSWLKDSLTCSIGTGSLQHLPCTFPDTLNFGLSYSTVVTVSGGIATLTTTLGAPNYRGQVKPSIAGRIVAAINGASNAYSTPITQAYFVADHNITTGVITIVVTSSASLDYLRPNGSVLPTDDFNWNDNDLTGVDNFSTNTTNTGDLVFNRSISPNGTCSGLSIGLDSLGNPYSCIANIWRPIGGSEVFTRSLAINIGNGSVYTHPSGETPLSLSLTILARGNGNREGSAAVRWLNSSGSVIRNWERLSSTNEGNGNDGGSGMADRDSAVVTFIPGAQRLQFTTFGANSFSGRILSVTYKR